MFWYITLMALFFIFSFYLLLMLLLLKPEHQIDAFSYVKDREGYFFLFKVILF